MKWVMNDVVTLRLSAGKGYRSPHVLAESNYVMASGRQLVIGKLGLDASICERYLPGSMAPNLHALIHAFPIQF